MNLELIIASPMATLLRSGASLSAAFDGVAALKRRPGFTLSGTKGGGGRGET